jgi:hypothetical protein
VARGLIGFRVGVNEERAHICPTGENLDGSSFMEFIGSRSTASHRITHFMSGSAGASTLDYIRGMGTPFSASSGVYCDGEKLTPDDI